jgi:hypothetical protein
MLQAGGEVRSAVARLPFSRQASSHTRRRSPRLPTDAELVQRACHAAVLDAAPGSARRREAATLVKLRRSPAALAASPNGLGRPRANQQRGLGRPRANQQRGLGHPRANQQRWLGRPRQSTAPPDASWRTLERSATANLPRSAREPRDNPSLRRGLSSVSLESAKRDASFGPERRRRAGTGTGI